MDNKQNKLISDIENLCYILLDYCENNIKNEEIQRVFSLIKCIYEKIEKLYKEINSKD